MDCENRGECRIQRTQVEAKTLAYFPPILNGFGLNVNQDKNKVTKSSMKCLTCGKAWTEDEYEIFVTRGKV